MRYLNIVHAEFLERRNRFAAAVRLDGREEIVHVKNTGRLRELLLPGASVVLTAAGNDARKTRYDLISVQKSGLGWVNIDSQACNRAAEEWLRSGPDLFAPIRTIRPEYTFGASRIDFYLESGARRILLEVKGCTLERSGTGYFPDAPTDRGIRHLNELAAAVRVGYECYLAFVIAMPGVKKVLPNDQTHPAFGQALRLAMNNGVKLLYLPCSVSPEEMTVIEYIKA